MNHPRAGSMLYPLYLGALFLFLVGSLVVRMSVRHDWLSRPLNVALGVAAVMPMFAAAVVFRRLLTRDLDELFQRVALEGFAFAFIVFLPIAALYTNLQSAQVPVPRLDPPDIVLTPAVLVALGMALAWRRYR